MHGNDLRKQILDQEGIIVGKLIGKFYSIIG